MSADFTCVCVCVYFVCAAMRLGDPLATAQSRNVHVYSLETQVLAPQLMRL